MNAKLHIANGPRHGNTAYQDDCNDKYTTYV